MFSIIEGHFIMCMPLLLIKVLSSAVKPRNHWSNFGSVSSRYSLARTSSNSDLQHKMHNCLPQSNKAQWHFKLYWFKVQFLKFDLMQAAHWFVWLKDCLRNFLLKVWSKWVVKPLFNNCLPHQQRLPSIIGVQWMIVKALRGVQEIQQHWVKKDIIHVWLH